VLAGFKLTPTAPLDELGERSHDLRGRLLRQVKQGHHRAIARYRVLMQQPRFDAVGAAAGCCCRTYGPRRGPCASSAAASAAARRPHRPRRRRLSSATGSAAALKVGPHQLERALTASASARQLA
jgi:hypothetical protein